MKFAKICSSLFVAAAALCAPVVSMAVPAKPGLLTMKQADGSELTVRLVGDEFTHYYLSEDNYLLLNVNDKFYYGNTDANGKIVNTGIRANQLARRTPDELSLLVSINKDRVMKALQAEQAPLRKVAVSANPRAAAPSYAPAANAPARIPSTMLFSNFPSFGKQKGVVILVQFSNTKFQTSYTAGAYDYFSRLLNQPGFSDYSATGSASDFFKACSNGQFEPEFDVYGPVTLDREAAYYGQDGASGNHDVNVRYMIKEACELLDEEIDFSQYDRDNDGKIDNVFVFYAGRGQATGGGDNTVWPHNSDLSRYGYRFDGKTLGNYACTNEWNGNRPDGIGTFCHEFGHVMGLPDLYETTYSTGAFTPGKWSIMDQGSYNNDSRTPTMYGVFERTSLGWLEPIRITGPANIELMNINQNEAYYIPTEKETEFFLIENRQQSGWDRYIPGHGMLIWHIDYSPSVWNSNTVNNRPDHQYVDIVEANNSTNGNDAARAGNTFPGSGYVTEFTSETTPALKSWSGRAIDLPLTDIEENRFAGIVTFKVAGGVTPISAVKALDATNAGPIGFTANWEASSDAVSYLLTVTDAAGNVINAYNRLDVGNVTSYTVTGLESSTTYNYYVIVQGNGTRSPASNTVTVTTGAASFDYATPVATAATDADDTSFTANWQSLHDAQSYILDVYTKVYDTPHSVTVDFTGNQLPDGWTSDVTTYMAMANYYNTAAPSLRMQNDGEYVESPVFEGVVSSFSLWVRANTANVGATNSLTVQALVGGNWVDFATINAPEASVQTFDEVPVGTTALRFVYNRSIVGSFYLDDITVNYMTGGSICPVEGLTDLNVGNTTSYAVTGLNSGTTYYYTVRGHNGSVASLRSNEIAVATTGTPGSGIGDINADLDADAPVEYYTLQGVRVSPDNLTPGFYVRRQGRTATKLYIK